MHLILTINKNIAHISKIEKSDHYKKIMHELSIATELFKQVEKIIENEHLNKVISITLKVGKLHQIVPEAFDFATEVITKGTKAEGVKIIHNEIPITIKCNQCRRENEVKDFYFICDKCGSSDVKIVSGNELIFESMEVE